MDNPGGSHSPKNGWLEYKPFLLVLGSQNAYFQGRLLTVSFREGIYFNDFLPGLALLTPTY